MSDPARYTQTILLRVTPELAAWLDFMADRDGHGQRAKAARDLLEELRRDAILMNEDDV